VDFSFDFIKIGFEFTFVVVDGNGARGVESFVLGLNLMENYLKQIENKYNTLFDLIQSLYSMKLDFYSFEIDQLLEEKLVRREYKINHLPEFSFNGIRPGGFDVICF